MNFPQENQEKCHWFHQKSLLPSFIQGLNIVICVKLLHTPKPISRINILNHYCDVIMGTVASQITSLTIVYTAVYSDADQSKHQSSASLAFVWGIHRRPVNSPHKWPATRKMFPFDDVIMHFALKAKASLRPAEGPNLFTEKLWSCKFYPAAQNFTIHMLFCNTHTLKTISLLSNAPMWLSDL